MCEPTQKTLFANRKTPKTESIFTKNPRGKREMKSKSAGKILGKEGHSLFIVRAIVGSSRNSASMEGAGDACREWVWNHGVRMDHDTHPFQKKENRSRVANIRTVSRIFETKRTFGHFLGFVCEKSTFCLGVLRFLFFVFAFHLQLWRTVSRSSILTNSVNFEFLANFVIWCSF